MNSPIEISQAARDSARKEVRDETELFEDERTAKMGVHVQLAINTVTAEKDKVIFGCRKHVEWLERKFLPCPDCRDKVQEGVCLRCENQNKDNVIDMLGEQLRTHIDLLQTLLEKFDERADGTSDATPLENFCNEMIGLYNGVLLKDTRTLIQDRNQLQQQLAATEAVNVKLREACESASTYYSGSLDHQPAYVRLCRAALNEIKAKQV